MDRHNTRDRRVRLGELVWKLEPDGACRLGEVVSRDEARSVFSVAWVADEGGAFHVPEKLLGLGVWGLGEPPMGAAPIAGLIGPVARFELAPFEPASRDDAEAA